MLGSLDLKDFYLVMLVIKCQRLWSNLSSINFCWFLLSIIFDLSHMWTAKIQHSTFNFKTLFEIRQIMQTPMIVVTWLRFLDKITWFSRSINGFLILYSKITLIYILDEGSTSPKAPPRDRRRDRSATRSSTSNLSSTLGSEGVKQQQPISHGLPPTPKVHMGACFSKVL